MAPTEVEVILSPSHSTIHTSLDRGEEEAFLGIVLRCWTPRHDYVLGTLPHGSEFLLSCSITTTVCD